MAPPVDEKTTLAPMPPGRFEDPDRPEHVHVGIDVGPLDRKSHVCLGREVKDRLRPRGVEDGVRVADVPDVELCARPGPGRGLPFDRSSSTWTSSPRASSASTTCDPMKPAPPVTTARMRLVS